MPRKVNGRMAYRYDGNNWHRVYDATATCKNCGPEVRAMENSELCHDCYNEAESAAHIPSPAEIKAALQEIQKDWSEREHRLRAGMGEHLPLEFKEYSARTFFGG